MLSLSFSLRKTHQYPSLYRKSLNGSTLYKISLKGPLSLEKTSEGSTLNRRQIRLITFKISFPHERNYKHFCTRKDLQKKFPSVDGVYGVVFRWKALSVKNIISAFTFMNSIKSFSYMVIHFYSPENVSALPKQTKCFFIENNCSPYLSFLERQINDLLSTENL